MLNLLKRYRSCIPWLIISVLIFSVAFTASPRPRVSAPSMRGFDQDPSCVLHLPFYKYGGEQQKIWDISGNNNHGVITGAVPCTYPMLSGFEGVTNGTFTGSEAGWTLGTGWAYSANTAVKNADGTGTCSQTVPIVVGKRYRLNFWISAWTVGTVTPSIGGFNGTASGANGKYEEIFVASSTAGLAFTPTDTSRFTLDTVSVQEVTGYTGLGWYFDGVDDQIVVPDTPGLRTTSEFTLIMWVLVPFPQASPGNKRFLFKCEDANNGYQILIDGGIGILHIATKYLGVDYAKSYIDTIPLGLWSNIAIVYDGTINTVYQRGIMLTGQPSGFLAGGTGNVDLFMGSNTGILNSKILVGEFIKINRALSAIEIRNFFELTRHRYGI